MKDNKKIDLTLKTSTQYSVPGNMITYYMTILNKTVDDIKNLVLIDNLNQYLSFVKGSVEINQKKYEKADIIDGIVLKQINSREKINITFVVEVKEFENSKISTKTSTKLIFNKLDKNKKNISTIYTSDELSFEQIKLNLYRKKITFKKTCDSKYISINDVVNFTIEITNTNDIEIKDVLLEETNSNLLSLVDSTFNINNSTINNVTLDSGINLGTINCGETIIVKYKAKILSSNYSCTIKNTSNILYYFLLPDRQIIRDICYSNVVKLITKLTYTKNFISQNKILIPSKLKSVDTVNLAKADVKIKNWLKLSSVRVCENSLDIINGVKLIITGIIIYKFEHNNVSTQDQNTTELPFTTSMILLCKLEKGDKISLSSNILNTEPQDTDEKHIFLKSTVELIANITHL